MKKLDLLLSAPRSDRRKKTSKTIEAYKIIRNTFRTKKQIDTKTKVFVFFYFEFTQNENDKKRGLSIRIEIKKKRIFLDAGISF